MTLVVKNMPANTGDERDAIQSLGQEDSLEKGKAPHSTILVCKIPWTEEPGGLPSMGLQESNITEHTVLKATCGLSLIFTTTLWHEHYLFPQFTKTQTKTQINNLPQITNSKWENQCSTLRCLTPKTMHRFRSHTAMNRFRSYINILKMHLSIYYVPATIQSSWYTTK